MAHEAVSKALKDAKIEYSQIKQAAVGYVYGTLNIFQNYICEGSFYNLFNQIDTYYIHALIR